MKFFTIHLIRIQQSDHNVVGAALELLNQVLSTYGKFPPVWGPYEQISSQSNETFSLKLNSKEYFLS